ncbi:porin family protein [Fretibacter rubidus]|uniref:porin family protein n=1 Tax=Fretibacter rubidus TaxID=570162 RepID=UPI00352ADA6B
MRIILLTSCALALSACTSSDLFSPQSWNQNAQSYNTHSQSAQHGTYNGYNQAHHGAQNSYVYPGHQTAFGAPVYVNPQGYAVPHYGQAAHHGAYHGRPGVPALRGRSQPRVYGNLGFIHYDVDGETDGAIARLGVQNGYLGAEIEASSSISDERDVDVDYSVAAFGVLRAPVSPRLNLLARAGYGTAEINNSIDADGFAYGAGAEYNFDAHNGLRLDYTRYELDQGLEGADSVSATFVRRF